MNDEAIVVGTVNIVIASLAFRYRNGVNKSTNMMQDQLKLM